MFNPVFNLPYVAFAAVLYFASLVLALRWYMNFNSLLLPMVLWIGHRFFFNLILFAFLILHLGHLYWFIVWDYVIELQAVFSIIAYFSLRIYYGKRSDD